MTWKPIATAPKDREIWLSNGPRATRGYWRPAAQHHGNLGEMTVSPACWVTEQTNPLKFVPALWDD